MKIGTVLEGKYKLSELIDANILSGLYLAKNIKTQKNVLVNFLPYSSAECIKHKYFNKFFVEGFNSNTFTQQKYVRDYPGIFISNVGETENSQVYLILEKVNYPSLTEVIKQKTCLSPYQAVTIGLQICNTIMRFNSLGIIYRHINPQTIMVNLSNNIIETKALDVDIDINKLYNSLEIGQLYKALGIALQKANNPLPFCTACGNTVQPETAFCLSCGKQNVQPIITNYSTTSQLALNGGSLLFFTPEQAQGLDQVYPQADIYIMGIVLYFMLSGEFPFTGKSYAMLLMQHIHAQPKSLVGVYPDISEQLEMVVARALAKDQRVRHQSFAELAKELKPIFSSLSQSKKKAPPQTKPSDGNSNNWQKDLLEILDKNPKGFWEVDIEGKVYTHLYVEDIKIWVKAGRISLGNKVRQENSSWQIISDNTSTTDRTNTNIASPNQSINQTFNHSKEQVQKGFLQEIVSFFSGLLGKS